MLVSAGIFRMKLESKKKLVSSAIKQRKFYEANDGSESAAN
jgi:hypothetical protein